MFKTNDNVKLKNSNIKGTIIRIHRNNTCTLVLENNSKLKVNENDIELFNDIKNSNQRKITVNYSFSDSTFNNEIMIRHQTVIEAIENVDRFISSAIINKEKRIRIIHGRHGGILREAVHEYLRNSPYVDNFKIADEYEGSIGVTIVYLK